MKKQHKYFRNLHHQEKLKGKGDGWRTYWSHVVYYTEEPDTREMRDCASNIYWRMSRFNLTFEEAINAYIEWEKRIGNGRFQYSKKPEVPYTIHKIQTDPKYSRRRKDLCKYANRRVRQRFKQYGDIYQHNEYKKVYDVSWEMD